MVDSEPPSTLSSSDAIPKAIAPESEPPAEDPQNAPIEKNSQDNRAEYITGYKLAVVIASVSLSCFLMLLDNLIISTVSRLQASMVHQSLVYEHWS
jgi:hypothetical protein